MSRSFVKVLIDWTTRRRDVRLRDALLERVAKVVAVAHPTNASGNNMSQR